MRSPLRKIHDGIRGAKRMDIPKVVFLLSLILLVFGYGIAVGRYQIFPYEAIKRAHETITLVIGESEMIAKIRPTKHLFKARDSGAGAVRIDEGQMSPGLTFVSGFFGDGLELRLMRPDGSIVNRWPVRFYDVFPDPSHVKPKENIPKTNWNTDIHGAIALPDGSVLFNFQDTGLVKMDRCGTIQWTLPHMTHHAVNLAHDGGFWIPDLRFIDRVSPFPALTPPYEEDILLKVSSEGKVETELSVLGLLFANNLQSLLFANGPDGIGLDKLDLTHLNDVKELSPEMARHFPQFAAGDLLVSLRNLSLVMVVDPATRKIKWYRVGPWMDQHDPDFLPNGKISVFSNNNDLTEDGSRLGGSTIIEVDPVSGASRIRYGGVPKQKMYTMVRGNHQNLENGNILIVESRGGRVIEVNPAGDVVWKFVNRFDDDHVAYVNDAIRYSPDYFKVSDWTCKK
jgi:Arylsulfotransferase (ASST)